MLRGKSGTPEQHVLDLLPGYALGSLDEGELLQVAKHLPGCPACRNELATYWKTTDRLALAATPRVPPADLRARVLKRVEQSSRRAALPPERAQSFWEGLRALFARPSTMALGALAVLLVLFLAVNSLLLWQRVNELQTRIPDGNMRIVQLAGTADAPQASGYMMVFKNETYGALAVEDAPQLDAGHIYQVWLIRDGQRTSGGVFSVNDHGYGTLEIGANLPLEEYQSFGITIEPAGGSPQPTGKKILGGSI